MNTKLKYLEQEQEAFRKKTIDLTKVLNKEFLRSIDIDTKQYEVRHSPRQLFNELPKHVINHLQTEPTKVTDKVKNKWRELGPIDIMSFIEKSVNNDNDFVPI